MDDFENDIASSLKTLLSGGILLYPTDTIWGLGCDATNSAAVKSIFELKKRAEKKSMIILVNKADMIADYVDNPSHQMLSFLAAQTRPTTAIFQNAINLTENLINEDGSIAIRIANDPFCQQLIAQLKKPLVSTSANISGEKFPQFFDEVSLKIKNGVDYIVQHRQKDGTIHSPSSIVKLNNEGAIEIIR